MRKALMLAGALALLLVPLAVLADEQKTANFMVRFDADSTSVTYCRTIGQNGDPYGGPIRGPVPISTSGSSTTVTGTGAFVDIAVGDTLQVTRALTTGATDLRTVTARASADSITVDSAVDWTGGFAFTHLKTTCGTTATSGWIDVAGWQLKTFTFSWTQGDADAIDFKVQCRHAGIDAPIEELHPGTLGTCGSGTVVSGYCHTTSNTYNLSIADAWPWAACRMGVKVTTTDTSDATTNLERVTGIVTVSRSGVR